MSAATLDTAIPSPSRAYDYLLGGREAFAADRDLVAAIEALYPDRGLPRQLAQRNRVFQELAVQSAVKDGYRQILVAGSGFPQPRDLHHVAAGESPVARCAYVDIDAEVISHGRALTDGMRGVTYAHADLARPGEVLADPDVRSVLSLPGPVVAVFGMVLHFTTAPAARKIIAGWAERLPAGSRIVVTIAHWTDLEVYERVREVYAPGEVFNHAPLQVQQWFRGMDLIVGIEIARMRGPEVLTPLAPACVLCGIGQI